MEVSTGMISQTVRIGETPLYFILCLHMKGPRKKTKTDVSLMGKETLADSFKR